MSKRLSGKSAATARINMFHPDKIANEQEHALVDAFGDYEQHLAFVTAIGDVLAFRLRLRLAVKRIL